MTRRLVVAMTALVAVVALALAIPLSTIVDTDERDAFIARLEIDTLSTASLLSSQSQEQWSATVSTVAERTGARVVVVDADRILVADSDRTDLDRTFDRAEINQALSGFLASDVRFSSTLGVNLRFVAAPVVQEERIVAAVRLSLPDSAVEELVLRTRISLALFVGAVVIAAALLAWIVAYSIATPLRRVAEVADDIGYDLDSRAREEEGPREVRSVARALNRTAGRLSALLKRQQRVAEEASHHLRTPLTGVRLRLEAIEDLTSDAHVRTEAQAAIAEVDRLSRRIEQVLSLARADAGASAVRVDVDEVVADRVAAASAAALARGITVVVAEGDRGCRVLAAEGGVARVLDELIGNALAYAASRVEIQVFDRGSAVEISVADDGPGIDEGETEAVFDRFTRGARAVPGGSGLGLALVRESARSVGGEAVACRSDLGGLQVITRWPVSR